MEHQDKKVSGRVALVGAGPGDASLLTVKAKEYIEIADCIVYDRLVSEEILAYADEGCELIFAGKENHHHVMKQDEINRLLAEKAAEKKFVVRLKGGDPYVFGQGASEALFLCEKGIDVEMVSGVSSVTAVPAAAGIPITHRGVSKGFYVVTAHSRMDEPADIDYGKMTDESVTYVFLMGLMHIAEIADGLMAAGRKKTTPAAVISGGTTALQRKCVGTLENIAELAEKEKLCSPATIVVGDVCRMTEELCFYERKPLFGRSFVVPYIERFEYSIGQGKKKVQKSRLSDLLREQGAYVKSVRIGKIRPVRVSMDNLFLTETGGDTWFVFTSAGGVNAFMWNLFEGGADLRALGGIKLAAVGDRTAEELKRFGFSADIVPEVQTAEGLAGELLGKTGVDDRMFYFTVASAYKGCGSPADSGQAKDRDVIVTAHNKESDMERILSKKRDLKVIAVYENIEVSPLISDADLKGYDTVFFTSASAVRRFMSRYDGKPVDGIKAVSIGPKVSKALSEYGFGTVTEADCPTYEAMCDCVLR